MKIAVHKGTNEIGGSCIEISTQNTTILFDYGTPLDNTSANISLDGLEVDAIVISHPHQDHFGKIETIDAHIPVYCGALSKNLMNGTKIFTGGTPLNNNFQIFKAWEPFFIGDIKITPFLVDHSAIDAYMFLIEHGDKKVIYSGDFRANGRKSKLFEKITSDKNLINVDVLLMEGTMLHRNNQDFPDEQSVEAKIFETIKSSQNISFMIGSSQNIDSIVSAYRACIKAKKIFVIDMYTAWVLDEVSSVSSATPTISWKNVKVLKTFGGNYYKKIKSNQEFFGDFKNRVFQNVITIKEIEETPSLFYIKTSPWHIEKIIKHLDASNANIIYSQWLGYLEPEFGDGATIDMLNSLKQKYNWIYAHTSGHADLESLQYFSKSLKPKTLIPIHTQYKQEFEKHFDNVLVLEDGEYFNISK